MNRPNIHPDTYPGRDAFTLVEMMVAMALTIFIMVILSQCFIQGLETFSSLKAVGDMQEQLRTAVTLMRDDLSQPHFEGERRLGDPLSSFISEPIREGFFVVGSPTPLPGEKEGEEDLIPSYRLTNHYLHFSVRRRGNAWEKFFSAVDNTPLPSPPVDPAQPDKAAAPQPLGLQKPQPTGVAVPGLTTTYFNQPLEASFNQAPPAGPPYHSYVYHSNWAEIAYFLVETGTTLTPGKTGTGGTKLYALYRCQFLVFPNTKLDQSATVRAPNTKAAVGNMRIQYFPNFSCNPLPAPPNAFEFYSPTDLAGSKVRRAFNPATLPPAPGSVPRAAALVLSNVVSFQVFALKNQGGDFLPLGAAFDTASYSASVTDAVPTFSVQGLQIVLRIWDPKSQLTRQVTLVQDM
jgi:type II secretory pathway component PulJ